MFVLLSATLRDYVITYVHRIQGRIYSKRGYTGKIGNSTLVYWEDVELKLAT